MTCRHNKDDPNCSSNKHYSGSRQSYAINASPDPKDFNIIDALEQNGHLILKVKYPSCAKCAYEGTKILVYFGTTAIIALKWNTIDPHFSDKVKVIGDAPSPSARFPASKQGWEDAKVFCTLKI